MTAIRLEWRKYRYFPYERDFAALEVARVFQTLVQEETAGVTIPAKVFRPDLADRLTYFSRAVDAEGVIVIPRQVRLEASASLAEREKQSTRYSAHGWHEYKGKFNPQVVRAIGNILNLPPGGTVLDPFCGSGTTLLECAHVGWSGTGVDRNPLAVRIANAKIRALHLGDGRLAALVTQVAEALRPASQVLSSDKGIAATEMRRFLGDGWLNRLPCSEYLSAWFPSAVLAQIVAIRDALKIEVPSKQDRDVFEVALSDHLRDASLQDPADLRIRRRKAPQPNYPLIDWYLSSLATKADRVARARAALGEIHGTHGAVLGDVCTTDLRALKSAPPHGFDAVITSPPYETALPYIDTHRLSLVLLGDVQANEIPATEKALIGAREISTSERRELEAAIVKGDASLPATVIDLCRQLLADSRLNGNGFRRVNRPALTFRYFMFMATFFRNLCRAVVPEAPVALVVGGNRTTLGGKEYVIDTPRLLADVAQHVGYGVDEVRPMETYFRYDLHSKNSIRGESLVVLRSPEATKVERVGAATSKPRRRRVGPSAPR